MTTNLTRRSVARGAAWAVPAVAIGAPAAQAAASTPVTVSGTICRVHNGSGTVNNEGTYDVSLGFSSDSGTIPKDTVITYEFTTNGSIAPTPSSSNLDYSLSVTGSGSSFVATLKFLRDTSAGASCTPYVVWQNTLVGGTDISVTTSVTGPSQVTGSAAGVAWTAARRYSGSSARPHTPTIFRSKSGAQTCFPDMDYDYMSHSNPANWKTCGSGNQANDTSTVYPDGCVMATPPFTGGSIRWSHC